MGQTCQHAANVAHMRVCLDSMECVGQVGDCQLMKAWSLNPLAYVVVDATSQSLSIALEAVLFPNTL